MIEHSCCCIWDFVMSGLNQIQFRFENPLKIGFEKFEKEKGIFFFGPHSPAAQCSACPPHARPTFPCARLRFLGRAQATAIGPSSRARGHVPHPSR
jgi:hypothetical protein